MGSDVNERVQKLKRACDQAYAAYASSCSHAVWYVISRYDPSQPYMQANELVDHLAENKAKWQTVALNELTRLANEGTLVVGGLKVTPGNGHVVVIYPGAAKPSGGYYHKDRTGKMVKQPVKGSYAPAMSTSIGQWPGARSNGDKTVFDAWGRDDAFKKVTFWKYVGP